MLTISMSDSLDPRREAHGGPAILAAFKKSVHRLFLMLSPTQSLDVLLHARADVCPCPRFGSSLSVIGPHDGRNPKHKSAYISMRGGVRFDSNIPSRENFNPHFRTFS